MVLGHLDKDRGNVEDVRDERVGHEILGAQEGFKEGLEFLC